MAENDDLLPPNTPGMAQARWFMAVLTLFEVAAAIGTVLLVKRLGGSNFAAYMWAMWPPLVGAGIYWLRTRHLSGASLAIMSFNLLAALVAYYGSHDSTMLLYKDSMVTLLIAVLLIGSLLLPKPLTFWFGQRFVTGGTPEGLAWWDRLWELPSFRRVLRKLCVLWAVLTLIQAGLKAFIIQRNSFEGAYVVNALIPVVGILIGAAATINVAQRSDELRGIIRALGVKRS